MTGETLERLLGSDGPLASALPRFEPRPVQLEMARSVERALTREEPLMVEAGTGTGKTLAYLLPAILSGKKVVISTATKTLQEQILRKDLPLVGQALGAEIEAAVLKGRQNYLCLERYERALPELAWPELQAWVERTTTGDRAELDLPEGFEAWKQLSTNAEGCLGPSCGRYQRCFVTQARARAAKAGLVVVNHHLFFADLALRTEGGGEGVLPDYGAVIFDEAHAVEEIAQEFLGRQVSTAVLEELGGEAARTTQGADGLAAALGLALQGRAAALSEVARAWLKLPDVGGVRFDAVLLEGLRTCPETQELLEALDALGAIGSDADEPALQSLSRRAQTAGSDLRRMLSADGGGAQGPEVVWAERRGRGVSFRITPVEVDEALRARLYAQTEAVVFTSGTLTSEGRFDFFAQKMGLAQRRPPARALRLTSPFDYAQQSALYLPSELPLPNEEAFAPAVAEALVALCELSRGRAFALFTSLKNMERVHRLVQGRLAFPLLLQGSRPKHVLLEAFQSEPSVLFASHSFWEGVDVPGDALSLVVIDKLPFASPGDPQISARIELMRSRGQDPFNDYQLPQAALSLQQGFGRLIRSAQDRGMVAILDPRLTTRPYGRTFLESLPPATRFRSFDALRRWWLNANRDA